MRMSLRWAKRSLDEFNREENPNALFAIVQGGMFEALRDESLAGLETMDFDGVAIGGLSVGEPKEDMQRILAYTAPKLPVEQPRRLPLRRGHANKVGLTLFLKGRWGLDGDGRALPGEDGGGGRALEAHALPQGELGAEVGAELLGERLGEDAALIPDADDSQSNGLG